MLKCAGKKTTTLCCANEHIFFPYQSTELKANCRDRPKLANNYENKE